MKTKLLVIVLLSLVQAASAGIALNFKATVTGCELDSASRFRCWTGTPTTFPYGVSYGNENIPAGANATVLGLSLGSPATNSTFATYAEWDGIIVYSRKFTIAEWNANITVNFDLGTIPGTACNTNTTASFTAKVTNPALYSGATAWWKKNGTEVWSENLGPGKSASYTFTYNPQSDKIEWGYTLTEPYAIKDDNGNYTFNDGTTDVTQGSATNYTGVNTSLTAPDTFNPPQPQVSAVALRDDGKIDWSGLSTTAARDDTLKAGFNALAEGNTEILKGLAAIAANSGGGSNSLTVNVTNTGWTNGLTKSQVEELNQSASNQLSGRVGTLATDQQNIIDTAPEISQLSGLLSDNQTGIGLGTPTLPTDSTPGSPGSLSIPIGTLAEIDLGEAATAYPYATVIRTVLIWIILFMLFVKIRMAFSESMSTLAQSPQATTAGETVLGNNLNAASALVMAAIIVALIFTALAAMAGYMVTTGAALATASSPTSTIGALGWGGGFVMTFLPLGYLVTCCLSYGAFLVLKDVLTGVAAASIKFATGL